MEPWWNDEFRRKKMQWSFNRFQSCIFQHSSFQIVLWNLCKFHISDRGEHHPRVHMSSNGTDWISSIKIMCMEFLQCDISWFFPFLKLTDATHKGQKQAHAVGRNWVKCKFDSLCAVWLHVTSKSTRQIYPERLLVHRPRWGTSIAGAQRLLPFSTDLYLLISFKQTAMIMIYHIKSHVASEHLPQKSNLPHETDTDILHRRWQFLYPPQTFV